MDVHPTKNVSIGIDPYPIVSRRSIETHYIRTGDILAGPDSLRIPFPVSGGRT
jgi:hypothetical protein